MDTPSVERLTRPGTATRHPIGQTLILCLALSALSLAWSVPPQPPVVDIARLPPLAEPWPERNPYRGSVEAARIGHNAFNQTCAKCHGVDADGSRAPAPDLRRLGRSCGRVQEPELKPRCIADVDDYFRTSVLKGKTKVGVEHMPPWEGTLTPELIWAIRTFVESQAPGRK